jgi:hypothetical protein
MTDCTAYSGEENDMENNSSNSCYRAYLQSLFRLSKGDVIGLNYQFYNFTVASRYIHVTDPCYPHDVINKGTRLGKDSCFGRFDIPAENGIWIARVTEKTFSHDEIGDATKLTEMVALHTVGGLNVAFHDRHHRQEFFNAVDSGQMGVFDSSLFPRHESRDVKRGFYKKCCMATSPKNRSGIIDGRGIVASSGWGDGSYRTIVTYGPNNRAVGVRLLFGFPLKLEDLT